MLLVNIIFIRGPLSSPTLPLATVEKGGDLLWSYSSFSRESLRSRPTRAYALPFRSYNLITSNIDQTVQAVCIWLDENYQGAQSNGSRIMHGCHWVIRSCGRGEARRDGANRRKFARLVLFAFIKILGLPCVKYNRKQEVWHRTLCPLLILTNTTIVVQ